MTIPNIIKLPWRTRFLWYDLKRQSQADIDLGLRILCGNGSQGGWHLAFPKVQVTETKGFYLFEKP